MRLMLLQLDPHSSNQKHITYNDLMFLRTLVPDPVCFFFFFNVWLQLITEKGERIQAKTSQWKQHLEKNLEGFQTQSSQGPGLWSNGKGLTFGNPRSEFKSYIHYLLALVTISISLNSFTWKEWGDSYIYLPEVL